MFKYNYDWDALIKEQRESNMNIKESAQKFAVKHFFNPTTHHIIPLTMGY